MEIYNDVHRKAESYCAFQERSQQEVRDKLYDWGLHKNQVEQIITELILDNFLNEERFAFAYAGGKHRIKKWGRFKIKQGLRMKAVSDPLIVTALAQLDPDEYLENLRGILLKKNTQIKEVNDFKRYQKLVNFAMMRGYEVDLIQDVLKEVLNSNDL